MIVTNRSIVYEWVKPYTLDNDDFVLMGFLWAIYIATVVVARMYEGPPCVCEN